MSWSESVRLIAAILSIAISVVIAGIVAPGLFFLIMIKAGSQRTIYERATSPDGWHEARVQFDDAGALSSFSRLVFVKHSWNRSDEPLLSCRAFWAEGEEPVHLRWLDSDTLLITHGFATDNVRAVADHCGAVRAVVRSSLGSTKQ